MNQRTLMLLLVALLSAVTLSGQYLDGALLYTRDGALWIANPDGTGQKQLVQGSTLTAPQIRNGLVYFLDWSLRKLYSINPLDLQPTAREVTSVNIPGWGVHEYSVSPAGTHIVLTYWDNPGPNNFNNSKMYVQALENPASRTLLLESPGIHNLYPHWAPDDYIYFGQANFYNAYSQRILRIHSTGGAASQLTSPFSQYVTYLSGQEKVAFISTLAYRLTLMDPNGTNQESVPGTHIGLSSNIAWAENLNRVYYNAAGEIRYVPLAGGEPTIVVSGVGLGSIGFGLVGVAQPKDPKSILLTFTGFLNAPGDCGQASEESSIYPPECGPGDKGMINAIENLKANLDGTGRAVEAQAFTFYTTGDGGDKWIEPKVTIDHSEAWNWLAQKYEAGDKVHIAGHSYGGNRARLFARALVEKHGIIPASIVTIDPIDWDACRWTRLNIQDEHALSRAFGNFGLLVAFLNSVDSPQLILTSTPTLAGCQQNMASHYFLPEVISSRIAFAQDKDFILKGYIPANATSQITMVPKPSFTLAGNHLRLDTTDRVQTAILNEVLGSDAAAFVGVADLRIVAESIRYGTSSYTPGASWARLSFSATNIGNLYAANIRDGVAVLRRSDGKEVGRIECRQETRQAVTPSGGITAFTCAGPVAQDSTAINHPNRPTSVEVRVEYNGEERILPHQTLQ